MRGYKNIIQEAELLAMSPEAVAEFLKKRAKQPMDELDHDPVDEEAEVALRGRSSPLIDLALARYARFMETLRPIFQSSRPCGCSSACSPLERDALARIHPLSRRVVWRTKARSPCASSRVARRSP